MKRMMWLGLMLALACGDDSAPGMDGGSDAREQDSAIDGALDDVPGTDSSIDSATDSGGLCAENERVRAGACESCPPGSHRGAGDDPTAGDTECADSCVDRATCVASLAAYVKASNTGAGDGFTSVALSDDGRTLAVGAIFEDSDSTGIDGADNDDATDAGAVYVFVREGATWAQEAYIKASNASASARFGTAVALSADGNTLAVGAPNDDALANDAGAAYVFTRSGTTWSEQSIVTASNADASDRFGRSLSLSADGDTLAIAAFNEDSNGVAAPESNDLVDSGAVYVFERSATMWTQRAFLKASNADASDQYGGVLALSADGNVLAVGATEEDSGDVSMPDDDGAMGSGAVYLLTRAGSAWTEAAYLKASNLSASDRFGFSIAASADGNTIAVGAVFEASGSDDPSDESALQAGAAYVFVRSGDTWNEEAYLKASNVGSGDRLGGAIALSASGDTLAVAATIEAGGSDDPTDDSAAEAGAAYVFTRADTAWSEVEYVKASNVGAGDRFGWSLSLGATGDMLVSGSMMEDGSSAGIDGPDDDAAAQSGAVYVYALTP